MEVNVCTLKGDINRAKHELTWLPATLAENSWPNRAVMVLDQGQSECQATNRCRGMQSRNTCIERLETKWSQCIDMASRMCRDGIAECSELLFLHHVRNRKGCKATEETALSRTFTDDRSTWSMRTSHVEGTILVLPSNWQLHYLLNFFTRTNAIKKALMLINKGAAADVQNNFPHPISLLVSGRKCYDTSKRGDFF